MKNLFLFSVLFLFGCEQENKKQFNEIVVDVNQISTEPAFKDFQIVQLELTEESMLKDIMRVAIGENRIYALGMTMPGVYIFDGSGKFITKLKRGSGPGEIIYPSDMQLKNDTLFVIDNYRKIKAYDIDGEYYKDVSSFKNPTFSFYPTENGFFLLDPNHYSKSDWMLSFLSNDGTLTGLKKKKEAVKNIAFISSNLLKKDTYSDPFTDTIFRIDAKQGQIEPMFKINFNGKFISPEIYAEHINGDDGQNEINKYTRWIGDVVTSGDSLFFSYMYDKNYFVRSINGKTQISSAFLSGFPPMNNKAMGAIGNKLIYAYQPSEMSAYMNENPIDPELVPLYNSASDEETANMLLVFVDAFPSGN
ncbi:MAG: 6-bladed beta-propeller [Bacteroidales bacterium]